MARNTRTQDNGHAPQVVQFDDVRTVVQLRLSRLQLEVDRLTKVLLALDDGEPSPDAEPDSPRRTRTKKMSVSQRAAVSKRMKKYWAARRKTAKSSKSATA